LCPYLAASPLAIVQSYCLLLPSLSAAPPFYLPHGFPDQHQTCALKLYSRVKVCVLCHAADERNKILPTRLSALLTPLTTAGCPPILHVIVLGNSDASLQPPRPTEATQHTSCQDASPLGEEARKQPPGVQKQRKMRFFVARSLLGQF